ncbi:MAG: nucleotide exchange factor GrpE [Planctomycetes bacterium]|nr:nucleotide exchange factor GrpE [Planctomycetota bacterium]
MSDAERNQEQVTPNAAGGDGAAQMGDASMNEGDQLSLDLASLNNALQDANDKYLRMLADYQNYQRRSLQNEVVAKREGAKSVVAAVVPVIDHFDLALAQDTSKVSAEQIAQGVKIIRDELMKALATQGVSTIVPQKNDLFEPGKHAAVMQQPADGVDSGHVVACFQAGYTFNDQVLRPAKVSVAP